MRPRGTRAIRALCVGAAILASLPATAVDSHDRAAFALGFQFTELHENFRRTIKKMSASSKEGLRKSLRKKMEKVQPHADSLDLRIRLDELVLNDLQGARSLADYNVALGRLRRNIPNPRAQVSYDLGRSFALMSEAYLEADTVSEHPFFGLIRPGVKNGVRVADRTRGKFYEVGHDLNQGLQRLGFTSKRLDMELTELKPVWKSMKALLDESNAYFGTQLSWDPGR